MFDTQHSEDGTPHLVGVVGIDATFSQMEALAGGGAGARTTAYKALRSRIKRTCPTGFGVNECALQALRTSGGHAQGLCPAQCEKFAAVRPADACLVGAQLPMFLWKHQYKKGTKWKTCRVRNYTSYPPRCTAYTEWKPIDGARVSTLTSSENGGLHLTVLDRTYSEIQRYDGRPYETRSCCAYPSIAHCKRTGAEHTGVIVANADLSFQLNSADHTWEAARTKCAATGGGLAEPFTETELATIKGIMARAGANRVWIGAKSYWDEQIGDKNNDGTHDGPVKNCVSKRCSTCPCYVPAPTIKDVRWLTERYQQNDPPNSPFGSVNREDSANIGNAGEAGDAQAPRVVFVEDVHNNDQYVFVHAPSVRGVVIVSPCVVYAYYAVSNADHTRNAAKAYCYTLHSSARCHAGSCTGCCSGIGETIHSSKCVPTLLGDTTTYHNYGARFHTVSTFCCA